MLICQPGLIIQQALVKAYVREKYEDERFAKAAENLYTLFSKAEKILALNNPIMMLVVYGCIIAISWFGAHFIVGGTLTTGNLTSLAIQLCHECTHVTDDAFHDLCHDDNELGKCKAYCGST